jgi:hypothetical protein
MSPRNIPQPVMNIREREPIVSTEERKGFEPMPPQSNTERYLAAILREAKETNKRLDDIERRIANQDYGDDVLAHLVEIRQMLVPPVMPDAAPEIRPEVAIAAHVLVSRLRCSCGFSVNPKGYALLKKHLAEHNPAPVITKEML